MRFSNAILDQIRARIPVSAIVGRKVQWDRRKSRPAKGDFWACCPFHGEKTPSFHVDDRRGIYHCFGCGRTGDQFRFICDTENLSFPEAVEQLAREVGVALPVSSTEDDAGARTWRRLMDGFETATLYFQKMLETSEGRLALDYAERRGLDQRTRATFRIGYAPAGNRALMEHLAASGLSASDMDQMGLVSPSRDGGSPYARFKDRLMVPIMDARGRVVGFGGRALREGQEPKYLNSPETPFFDKGRVLYNHHRARTALAASTRLIVVEGYLDAIALHRAGFEAVVASLGTAVTEEQISLLWQLGDEPVVCFDGDSAGLKAAVRVLERALPLLKPGKSLSFVALPEGEDPDDVVTARGKAGLNAILETAKPLVEALWEELRAEMPVDTPERLAALDQRINTITASINDQTIRRNYLDALRMRMKDLRDTLFRPRGRDGAGERRPFGTGSRGTGAIALQVPDTRASADIALLGLCLAFPDYFHAEAERILSLDALDGAVAAAFAALDGVLGQDPDLPPAGIARALRISHGALVNKAYGAGDTPDALALRHPVIGWAPPPAFIARLAGHYILTIELRAMEREAADAMQRATTDEAMTRVNALSDALRQQRQRLAYEDVLLEEDLAIIRSAHEAMRSVRGEG